MPSVVENGSGRKARVQVGEKQYWYFRETDAPEKPYDRHHAQIYIANFSGPYQKLKELGLITHGMNDHEYRFKDIVDLDTRKCCSPSSTRSAARPIRSMAGRW